jgi:hypothetical protein
MNRDPLDQLRAANPAPHGSAPPLEMVLGRLRSAPPPRRPWGTWIAPALGIAVSIAVFAVAIGLLHSRPSHRAPLSSPQPLSLRGGLSGEVAPLGFALSADRHGIIALVQSCPCSDSRRGERYLTALTANGGRTWTLAGDPPGMGAPQLSGPDGWAEGGTRTASLHFYVTHDDGLHWAVAPGAVPSPGPSFPSIAGGEVWSFSGCVHGCGVKILHAPVSASRLTATAAQPIPDNHNNTQVLAVGTGSAYVVRWVAGSTVASTVFITHDDGRSWRRLTPLHCANGQLSVATPTVLYAQCRLASQQTVEIIRSTDGGLHWHPVATEPGWLTMVPAGGTVLWAIASQMLPPRAPLALPVVHSQVIRSIDGGVHWQPVFDVPEGRSEAVDDTLVATGPSSAELLVSAMRGGRHGQAPSTALIVYRTADAGRDWTPSAIR